MLLEGWFPGLSGYRVTVISQMHDAEGRRAPAESDVPTGDQLPSESPPWGRGFTVTTEEETMAPTRV